MPLWYQSTSVWIPNLISKVIYSFLMYFSLPKHVIYFLSFFQWPNCCFRNFKVFPKNNYIRKKACPLCKSNIFFFQHNVGCSSSYFAYYLVVYCFCKLGHNNSFKKVWPSSVLFWTRWTVTMNSKTLVRLKRSVNYMLWIIQLCIHLYLIAPIKEIKIWDEGH